MEWTGNWQAWSMELCGQHPWLSGWRRSTAALILVVGLGVLGTHDSHSQWCVASGQCPSPFSVGIPHSTVWGLGLPLLYSIHQHAPNFKLNSIMKIFVSMLRWWTTPYLSLWCCGCGFYRSYKRWIESLYPPLEYSHACGAAGGGGDVGGAGNTEHWW